VNRAAVLLFTGITILLAVAAVATSEGAVLLLFGWVAFLSRVLPEVTADGPTAAAGVASVVLFALGVHLAGRAWLRARGPERTWKLRWTAAVVVGVFVLFAAGIAVVGIAHQCAWLATADRPLVGQRLRHDSKASQNNLRMIGLGLLPYADVNQTFPPGGTFGPNGEMLHSWETHILPYMVYGAPIDMKRPWRDPVNEPYFRCVIPEFINPEFRTQELEDADGFGLSHYAANVWVMGPNRRMKPSDIHDGTAGTILVGEVNACFRPWGHPRNWRDPADGINNSPRNFGGPPASGGVRFLMADGSVRFVSARTDPAVLRALATPNGGEEVPP
jgi:hypothetical protein